MANLVEFKVNEYKLRNGIKTAEGVEYKLNDIKVDIEAKKYANATFYMSCSSLFSLSEEMYRYFVSKCVSDSLIASGRAFKEEDKDKIRKQIILFSNELNNEYSDRSIREIERVFYLGGRGKLGFYENKQLNLANFALWIDEYDKIKNVHMKNIILQIQKMPPKKVDYIKDNSFQEKTINEILLLKSLKSIDFEKKLNDFLIILPKIVYDLLVEKKHLKENDYENYISEAKKKIEFNDKKSLNYIKAVDFIATAEEKTLNNSYRLSIINFIKSYVKKSI